VLQLFPTPLCCSQTGGVLTQECWGVAGTAMHPWGPISGSQSGALYRGWSRPGGSQTGILGPLIMSQSWGPVVTLEGSIPGSPLIQDILSRNFRVLKQKPPGPMWSLFSSRARSGIRMWLRGTGMSQHLQAHCHLLCPRQGPSLSPMPQFPSCVRREGLQTVMFQLLTGTRGVGGGPGEGCTPMAVFYPSPCRSGAFFFSLGMHCGGSFLPVLPGSVGVGGGHSSSGFVRAWPTPC